MKSCFEKMPLFGRALPEQKREDVDNIRSILDVEDSIAQEVEKAKQAGFPTDYDNSRPLCAQRALWMR
ncbi:MAG: hypothetical protein P8X96_21110 [Desulfobacteraceae bacterium]|jgi:hypothetical protein